MQGRINETTTATHTISESSTSPMPDSQHPKVEEDPPPDSSQLPILLRAGDSKGFDMLKSDNGQGQFHLYLENNDTQPRSSLMSKKRPVSTGSIDFSHELLLRKAKRNKKLRHDQPSKQEHTRNDDGSRDPTSSHEPTPSSASAKDVGSTSKRPVPNFHKSHTIATTRLKCTDCGTLETPQWRSGPRGTLCNFCGLVWKKRNNKQRRSLSL